MKIVQVCGTNGVGKTTLVRTVLNNGEFERREITVGGEQKEVWFDGETAIVGRYGAANCGGVDADKYTGAMLISTITNVIERLHPKNVVLEDFRFGCLYSFKQRIMKVARRDGYAYVNLLLTASLKTIIERVIGRSGNPDRNFDAMFQKQRSCLKAAYKARRDGARVIVVDTDAYGFETVLSTFYEVLSDG